MHKYNNQDHSMMTGIFAAQNIVAGYRVADPWQVNEDAEYVENGNAVHPTGMLTGERLVPLAVGPR
jgi:hypothetical protein